MREKENVESLLSSLNFLDINFVDQYKIFHFIGSVLFNRNCSSEDLKNFISLRHDEIANLALLEKALKKSWSSDTCYPPQANEWNQNKPCLGQYAVTALVVQKFLGGTILYNGKLHHYWNKISSGRIVDFTKKQYGDKQFIIANKELTREDVLGINQISDRAVEAETMTRYFLLLARVERNIKEMSGG